MQAVTAKKKTFKNPFSENAQNVSKTEPVQESSKEPVEADDDDKRERLDDDKCKKNVDQTVSDGPGQPCVNKSSDEVKEKEVNGNVSQPLKKEKKAVPSFQALKKDKVQKSSKENNGMQGDEKVEKKKPKKEKNENNVPKEEKVVEKTKKPKVPKQTKSEKLPPLTREDYEEIFKAVIGPSYTSVGHQVGGNGDKTENKEEEKQTCDKGDTENEGKTKKTEIDCENDEEMTEDKSITSENKEEEGKDQKMTHIDSDSENTEEVAEKTATKNDCDDEKTTENKERMDINKENSHTGIDVEIKKKKKKKAKVLGENENNETVKIKEKKKTKVTKTCDDNEEKVRKKKKVTKINVDETIEIKKKKKDQSVTNVECNNIVENEEGEEILKAAEVQECYSNEDVEHENDEEMAHCSRSNVDNGDQNPSGLDSFNEIQQINEVTPEGSEVDDECLTRRTNETPPPKKKPKIKSVPKKVIKPKKLHFEKSDLDKVENGSNKKKVNKKMEQVLDVEVKRKKTMDRKRMFVNREYTSCGTWVQCCECEKWRLLLKIDDPTELPDRWLCKMNTDNSFNSCDTAEQSYDESDHIFTKYSEGSVVWARIAGYPWWPAMIELDPDTESFYAVVQAKSQYPTHYHVVFFDEKVTRSWVKSSSLMQFVGKENLDFSLKGGKHASFKKDINTAKENALNALKLPVKERIKQYSFGVRFKGKWCKSVEESLSEDDDHMKEKKKQKSGKKRKNLEKHRATTDKMIDVLDNTTVDDILQNPDDVLKGFEEVLESIDSDDELSEVDSTDVKKGKFDFEPDESESDEDMNKKLKLKQHKKEKQEKKTKSKKKEKEPKSKSGKVKKRKMICDDDEVKQSHTNKTIEKDNEPSNESECDSQKDDEMKLPVVESSSEDTCELQIETTSEGKTGMKFDSEIFTIDMDSSEKLQSDCDKAPEKCKNAKKSGQKKNKGFSVPPKSKDQPKNDECLESNTGIKPVTETLELNLEEHLEVQNESENISDVKPTEQDLEFKFEEDYVDDKMIDPNEQTVPSLDNDITEEDNDELSLDIPVNDISKHSTENVEINTNVAVLVTDYDTEGSDPFDMEE